jgi:hypothetical protein
MLEKRLLHRGGPLARGQATRRVRCARGMKDVRCLRVDRVELELLEVETTNAHGLRLALEPERGMGTRTGGGACWRDSGAVSLERLRKQVAHRRNCRPVEPACVSPKAATSREANQYDECQCDRG